MNNNQRISPQGLILKDQLISINRVTKVVKGGKNLSFAALVVVGDEAGHVGFGTGKAKEVPNAIKKAVEAAKKNLIRVPLIEGTLPHQIIGEYGAIAKTEFDPAMTYRNLWTRYFSESARQHGIAPFYWDNGYPDNHQFGLFNRATGAQYYPATIRAIFNLP